MIVPIYKNERNKITWHILPIQVKNKYLKNEIQNKTKHQEKNFID